MKTHRLLLRWAVLSVRILLPAYRPSTLLFPSAPETRSVVGDPFFSFATLLHLACLSAALPDFLRRPKYLRTWRTVRAS